MNENNETQKTTADYTRPCPYCGEPMPMNERLCESCGYYETAQGGYKPLNKIKTRSIKIVLGFIAIVAALVIIFLINR